MKSKWQLDTKRDVSHLEIQTDAELPSMLLVERSLGKSTYRLDPGFLKELIEHELQPKVLTTSRAQESRRSFSALSHHAKRTSPRTPQPYTPSRQPTRHVYGPALKYLLPLPASRSVYSRCVLRHVPGLSQPVYKSYHGSSPAQRFM